eukprot:gene36038-3518_t
MHAALVAEKRKAEDRVAQITATITSLHHCVARFYASRDSDLIAKDIWTMDVVMRQASFASVNSFWFRAAHGWIDGFDGKAMSLHSTYLAAGLWGVFVEFARQVDLGLVPDCGSVLRDNTMALLIVYKDFAWAWKLVKLIPGTTEGSLLSVFHHGLVEGKSLKFHFTFVDGDNEPTQMRDLALIRLAGPMHSTNLIIKDATGQGRMGKAVPTKAGAISLAEAKQHTKCTLEPLRITTVRMGSTAFAVDRDLKMKDTIVRTSAPQTSTKWTRHEQATVLLRPVIETVCDVQILSKARISNVAHRMKIMRNSAHDIAVKDGVPAKFKTSARLLRDLIDERAGMHVFDTDFWLIYELTLTDTNPLDWDDEKLQTRMRLFNTYFDPWQKRWEKPVQINYVRVKSQLAAIFNQADKGGTYKERMHRVSVDGAPQDMLKQQKATLTALRNRLGPDTDLSLVQLYMHGPYMLTPCMHAANRLAADVKRQEKSVKHNAFYNELLKKACLGL